MPQKTSSMPSLIMLGARRQCRLAVSAARLFFLVWDIAQKLKTLFQASADLSLIQPSMSVSGPGQGGPHTKSAKHECSHLCPQAADPRMRSTAISKAKSTYKTFHDLPPLPEGCHFSEGFEAHQPGQHMYMALGKGKEAKVATVAMWKNTAGRMCGMAALNHWEQWGHTPDEMKASGLPIPEPWLRAIGKQFDEQDFNGFGRIVKCTRVGPLACNAGSHITVSGHMMYLYLVWLRGQISGILFLLCKSSTR